MTDSIPATGRVYGGGDVGEDLARLGEILSAHAARFRRAFMRGVR